ncbi:MAG: AAA family ATPase [Myxococcota bacterium]
MADLQPAMEMIHHGRHTDVYRTRLPSGRRVVAKALRGPHPSDEARRAFEREIRITRRIVSPGVIDVLEVDALAGQPRLLLDDFGGHSLAIAFRHAQPGVPLVLRIARKLVQALGAVHAAQVVHKDVCPGNVVWNAETEQLALIDFGIAAETIAEEGPGVAQPLEGTLRYLAPEQSGRLPARVDRRADYYALGATLYELFAGRPPFVDDDPLTLLHAHLARAPESPSTHNARVPPSVSAVVLKLLAKRPEDRYQSLEGLDHDLVRCAAIVAGTASSDGFVAGSADASRDLTLSRALYGRDEALRTLTRAARRPEGSMVLVEGSGGIGKTRLIDAMWRELAGSSMRFARGKCGQFERGRAYSAVSDAIEGLVVQLLSEGTLDELRHRLGDALGESARALGELVPSLETLLERTPPLAPLGPEDAERRLHRTLMAFFYAVADDRRLALVIDDLQWADAASIRLLASLNESLRSLVVVGTYRPEEVGPEHGLQRVLPAVETRVRLKPLDHAAAHAFVRDSLHPAASDVSPLVECALDKTQGNPLYLSRYLHALEQSGVLHFEFPSGWRWDLERARGFAASENVVEFMVESLEELPAACRHALQAGAVVGDRFRLEDVAPLLRTPEEDVRGALQPALAAELLASPRGGGFRFAHDRVRQAVMQSLDAGELAALHAAWGRRLQGRPDASVLDVAHHLNAGRSELTSDERQVLGALNARAGRAALDTLAFAPALRFFEAGLKDAQTPRARFDLRFGVATAAQLVGERARSEAAIDAIVAARRILEPVDVARALQLRVRLAISASELERAVDVGFEALDVLGVSVSAHASKMRVVTELARTRLALRGRGAAARAADPELTDEASLMAMELLTELAPPLYLVRARAPAMIGCAMARVADAHGVSSQASVGYAFFALVLNVAGDQENARAYADLAEALGRRFPDERMASRRTQLLHGFIHHWTGPVLESVPPLRRAFESAVDHGDFVWSAFCGTLVIHLSFWGGAPLEGVLDDATRYTKAAEKLQQDHAVPVNASYIRAVEHLVRADGEWSTNRLRDGDALYGAIHAQANKAALFDYYLIQLLLALVFGDERAVQSAVAANPHVDSVASSYFVPVFFAFDILAHTRNFERLSRRERSRFLTRAFLRLRRLRRWAKLAPQNHASRLALAEAELARVTGRRSAALAAYDEAIVQARRHAQHLDAAMAGEFAADYQRTLGNALLAQGYLANAAVEYGRWGARRKLAELVRAHPELMSVQAQLDPLPRRDPTTTTGSNDFDGLALMKLSRALSEHLAVDDLIDALGRITLEVGGGTRAALLDPEGRVRATAATDDSDAPIPERVVQYVMRTQQDLLLGDAAGRGLFRADPVIRERQLRSVLCLPVLHQGEVRAVLYVEHGALPDAFSKRQLEVLRLISAQASTSLENARLYANLERSLDEQVKLTTAHARFVPHQFLEALQRDRITEVALGDHVEKEMTILFSDIRGFTAIVENLTPAENIAFINDYLAHMEPAIVEQGGFVDSYIGDAIMALFDRPDDALRAGIAMQASLRTLNEARAGRGAVAVQMGIGVNTGGLMLGTIGGSTNLKCGVIGDSVNLASRVESLTKHYGSAMLVSDNTKRRLREPGAFTFRHVERIVPVGTSEALTIYELVDADAPERAALKRKTAADYEAALDAYYERRFREAKERFENVVQTDPNDATAERYRKRCEDLETQGAPKDWDGVVRMTQK